ncbi:hypothetical protein BGX23_007526 [Mortierella sp. AD031]|nr:hypothetical protein BGX23_007526 [Mortierella sp. AD031]
MHVTETRKSKGGGGSDSESAEDPLSEHQVRTFMGGLQSDIHDAKELASSLEHSLHQKLQSGNETIRRASKDLTSNVIHAFDDVVRAVSGEKGKAVRRGSHHSHTYEDSDHHYSLHKHSRHCRHDRHGEEEQGLCGQFCSMIKHCFANCALRTPKSWQVLHDLGSNSLDFVWTTLLLELTGFLTSAYAQHSQSHPTGLLSRKTSSGLSYFVFKFALTYFLSQTLATNLCTANSAGLVGLAKEAVETAVNYSGFGVGHRPVLMKSCCLLPQVFRYVPESVSLATSGVGTVLALAETILSRRQ